ncbi:hypothetical protein [Streptomyces sp. NPDC007346]|uniref:hypothetical protein n=1 Tax=Streptomyces sp. NPDC007346 TaxID=3154682 RepID=UPI003454BF33
MQTITPPLTQQALLFEKCWALLVRRHGLAVADPDPVPDPFATPPADCCGVARRAIVSYKLYGELALAVAELTDWHRRLAILKERMRAPGGVGLCRG